MFVKPTILYLQTQLNLKKIICFQDLSIEQNLPLILQYLYSVKYMQRGKYSRYKNPQKQMDYSLQEYKDQIMFANDEIKQVDKLSMKLLPHNNIAAIICRWGDTNGAGSGFLISPNLVLTCGHIFFRKGQMADRKIIRIFPGQYGQLGDGYEVEQFYIPSLYMSKKIPEYDYALIKLKKKVLRESYLSLHYKFNQKAEQNPLLGIYGYPGINYQITFTGQFKHAQSGMTKEGKELLIFNDDEAIFRHFISMHSGHSGSPVLLMSGQYPSVIGIHRGSRQKEDIQSNIGIRISKELIEDLQKQSMLMGAQLFTLTDYLNISKIIEVQKKQLEIKSKITKTPNPQFEVETESTRFTEKIDGPYFSKFDVRKRQFSSKLTIINQTERNIIKLTIQHRIHQQSYHNVAILRNLKKGKQISCLWTFTQQGPSIVNNIVSSLITFGTSNIKNNWGKDYWLIYIDFEGLNYTLTTNCKHPFNQSKQGDKWFADVVPQDRNINLIIRQKSNEYQVALNRNNVNGESTRYMNELK